MCIALQVLRAQQMGNVLWLNKQFFLIFHFSPRFQVFFQGFNDQVGTKIRDTYG